MHFFQLLDLCDNLLRYDSEAVEKITKRNPRTLFYPLAFVRILISLKLNWSQYNKIE
jgi:hypothetical protein